MTKRIGNKISVNVYKSYRFVGQDPALRNICKIIEDREVSNATISKKSGASKTTIYNWRCGKTMRPIHATLEAVAHTMGYSFQLTPTKKRNLA